MTDRGEYQSNGKRLVRAHYQPPKLRVYGAIKDLTAAGTGVQQEKGGSKDNPQKRP